VNTFNSIREFIVPKDVCDQTDRALREAGLGGNERFVLWSGLINEDRFLATTFHSPKQTAYQLPNGLGVRVEANELHQLNRWLYENGERLAVQVHSHPTEAFHSDTDDAFPMVTTLGGLSLVVPDFCRNGVRGPSTALYRLTLDGWEELSPVEARRVLRLEA
jgi:hypothetical protein